MISLQWVHHLFKVTNHNMAQYLITGGAGYIGSHVVKQLIDAGHDTYIVDNLSSGFQHTIETLQQYAVSKQVQCRFEQLDLSEWSAVVQMFDRETFDGVIHFAARVVVPESVVRPLEYYLNNTANTMHLVDQCVKHGVQKFIFSSTAAVYGEPDASLVPVSEDAPTVPINPYGWSKLCSEQVIKDAGRAYPNFKYTILRYFNVAGADVDGLLGQSTEGATHLIKIASEVAAGVREQMTVFGTDYETEDGTCVRDYIHVSDLADAHIQAFAYLDTHESDIFNCGYGVGFSVRQIIDTMTRVSGVELTVVDGERRVGDPAILIADNHKIVSRMGWAPRYQDIELICKTALLWEQKSKV